MIQTENKSCCESTLQIYHVSRSVPVRCGVWWRFTMPSMRTGTRKREGVLLEHGVSVALRATCRSVVSPCDGCEILS